MRTIRRAAAWAVCIACIAVCAAGFAAEQPAASFSGAMQLETDGPVRADGYIEIAFMSPTHGGMDGTIETSANLELAGFSSAGISAQLSADNHVVSVFGDPVKYVYKVTGAAGEQVSVRLKDAECTDGVGGLFEMADETLEAVVKPATDAAPPPAGLLGATAFMRGPDSGSVPAGGTVDIVFRSPEGGGMDGEIQVSDNLVFESMRSEDLGVELSAKDHVVSLFGDAVTYTYRVDAAPGEPVSVRLVNAKMADQYRNLYTVPEQSWTGEADNSADVPAPAPVPTETQPAPPAASSAPTTFLHPPEEAVAGRCIEVQITSPRDGGLEGYLEVSDNLSFEGLRGGFLSAELSTEDKAVSLFGEPLTYVYRVNAAPGEIVSVSLVNGQQSDGNCNIAPVETETWTGTVLAAAADDVLSEEFVAMMRAPQPEEVVAGHLLDVSFLSPVSGGMDGLVTTSSNLEFEEVISAGNGARISTDDKVRSLLGVPVTYRFRVTGDAGEPVYIRLTDGRMADGEDNSSGRVRNQIWMGVVQETPAGVIGVAPGSGLQIQSAPPESAYGPQVLVSGVTMSGSDLLKNVVPADALQCTLENADGSPADLTCPAATGQVIVAADGAGEVGRIEVVITGDVSGSGRIGVNQVVRAALACTGSRPLTGAYLLAGDLNRNGAMDVGDLARMVSLIQLST